MDTKKAAGWEGLPLLGLGILDRGLVGGGSAGGQVAEGAVFVGGGAVGMQQPGGEGFAGAAHQLLEAFDFPQLHRLVRGGGNNLSPEIGRASCRERG